MVFQPARRTAIPVARNTGELLPHLFTLSLKQVQGGYFLFRFYTLTDIFLSEVRCSVLPGLSSPLLMQESDRKACLFAKVDIFPDIHQWPVFEAKGINNV
jgi:hypothetical protein